MSALSCASAVKPWPMVCRPEVKLSVHALIGVCVRDRSDL